MSETSGGVATFGINTLAQMPKQCGYCGAFHGPRCPSVRAIDYYPDGTVKRVEFVPMTYSAVLGGYREDR